MATEYRVIGPPGTGKTTYLARQAAAAAERFGGDRVVLTSLTRAAAAAIAGRETGIPRENVTTLHGLAWRALDRPTIAESRIAEWNRECPSYAIGGGIENPDDAGIPIYETAGDDLLACVGILRHRGIDDSLWPIRLRDFHQRWEAWKARAGLLDFTDLIFFAATLPNTAIAPGAPMVLMGDEAQDWSMLEASLMRRWGEHVQSFVLVGDPDQSIFGWRGADPAIFQTPPVPDNQRRVLKQSYRVPRAVHRVAMDWIAQITTRDPIEYHPRREDGFVKRVDLTIKTSASVIEAAEGYAKQGKSVLILTTCGYMLSGFIGEMRERGIPFHNPYRRNRGDWNPLASHGATAGDRIVSFIEPSLKSFGGTGDLWRRRALQLWSDPCRADALWRRGGKSDIAALDSNDPAPLTILELESLFKDTETMNDAIAAASMLEINWLLDRLLPSKVGTFQYSARVFTRGGVNAIRDTPKIMIGTIHSVKGGEADVVILFPDLSPSGMRLWINGGAERDEIIRLFYVGITRAREGVLLCDPASGLSVGWRL